MAYLNKSMLTMVGGAVLVSACGGGSSDSPEQLLSVPEINQLSVSMQSLSTSAQKAESIIKNGVYMRSNVSYITTSLPPTADAAALESSTSGGSRFSTTITQEQNVDEADRIKYDGDYLYIASNGSYPELIATTSSSKITTAQTSSTILEPLGHQQNASVRVLQRQNDASLVEVNTLNLLSEDESGYISGLYLSDNRLAAIYDKYNYSGGGGIGIMPVDSFWRPFDQDFGIQIYDRQDPAAMDLVASYSVDGRVISSRRVGDQLIVASTYAPNGPQLLGDQQTIEGQKENYNQIVNTDVTELLPAYTDSDGNEHSLVNVDQCYVNSDAKDTDGFDAVVTLSSFSLTDGSLSESVCVLAYMDNFYVSASSIYLFASDYSNQSVQSVIHKFSLSDTEISYQATGNLEGEFGWNQPQMRFSEKGDFLRVVSTNRSDSGPEHYFNVLQQSGSRLELMAQLPNEANPAPIGKPDEDIYAVRYFGDKAYIVTFFRRDPLYVLDLSDNLSPKVQGELDIPGYSAYLHPLGENFILGVGQQVDENAVRPLEEPASDVDSDTTEVAESPIEEGAKVELYDVSDPTNPQVVNSIVFNNGYTPVEWDYHALTYLALSETEHKFALPIESWSTTSNDDGSKTWSQKVSLQLIDVNLTNTGSMTSAGEVIPSAAEAYYYGGWEDRAVIHGDLIYYVHGDYVWQSLWSNPATSVGPY